MNKIVFKNGTLVAPAKVKINNIEYDVIPEIYDGEIPISAEILNQMQDNIENAINKADDKIAEMFEWSGEGSDTNTDTLTMFTQIDTIIKEGKTVLVICNNNYNSGSKGLPAIFVMNNESGIKLSNTTFYYGMISGINTCVLQLSYNNSSQLVKINNAKTTSIIPLDCNSTDNTNYFRPKNKSQPVSSGFLDEKIGDIATILDNLNGEEI